MIGMRLAESCVGCEGPTGDRVLCDECRRNPFTVEAARKAIAKRRDFGRLRELYTREYAFLHQGEPGTSWDDIHLDKGDPTLDYTLWRNRISAAMVPERARSVLEIGIGMGHAIRYLAAHRPELALYGTDVSEAAVRRAAKEFPSGRFSV